MDQPDLKERIRRGQVAAEHLPQVFEGDASVSEEYRFRAVSIVMRRDPDAAGPYLERIDPELLADAVEQHRVEPEMIDLAMRAFPRSERLREAVIRSPRSPEQALLIAASEASETQLTPLLRDESRLVLSPELLSSLSTRNDLDELTRRRLLDLLARVERDRQYQIRPDYHPERMNDEDQNLMLLEWEDARAADRENIYAKLLHMSAAEKALLGMKANRMTRMILVRDPNPMVARSVMRNPRLDEQDVEMIARTREVDDEVLYIISLNRLWMRKYAIMRNLALNPRTPITIALGLLERLNNSDIKMATREHNLSNPVKQAVKRLARRRGLQ